MAEEVIPASAEPTPEPPKEDAPAPEPKEAAEKQAAPTYLGTKHKVKVDDQEEEVLYEDLIRDYQKGKAGDKKLREAAQMRQQIEQVLSNLKSGNHKNLVKILGKQEARKLAEELLLEELEFDELPEHEKTIRQLQQEKEALEAEKKREAESKQKLEQRQLEERVGKQIEDEILAAIKDSNVKVTPRLVGRMAEVMDAYITRTQQRLPAKDALAVVRGEIPLDFAAYVEGLSSPEEFRELKKVLPKKFLDALRKDDVDAVLSQSSISKGRTKESDNLPARTSDSKKNRMSLDEKFSQMEKKFAGG